MIRRLGPQLAAETPISRPKLLFVVNLSTYFVSHRIALARRALEAGYEVHVATRLESEAHARQIEGAGIIPHYSNLRRGTSLVGDFRGFFDLLRVMREIKFDIVHLVTVKMIVLGGIAARLAGTRAVVAAATGLGEVFTATGLRSAIRRKIVVWLLGVVTSHRRCLVICQNADDRALLVESGAVRPGQVRLIRGSGVDVGTFRDAPEVSGALRVILGGRMLRSKGVLEFIQAADTLKSQWPGVEFLLAGDVDEENPTGLQAGELQDLCKAGNTRWLGHVPDMPSLISSAHVVVLASQDREGLPKFLLEAAACGRPIVGTDIPGIREIVLPDVNGFLVPPRASAALADAIGKLLADADLRRRFGAAGRELVERELGMETVVAATLGVYRELLANA